MIEIHHKITGVVLMSVPGDTLHGANLQGANLRGADLTGADLSRAKLYGADLYGAKLCRADLRRTDLRDAKLFGANLRGADLTGADLSAADLNEADLRRADLRGTGCLWMSLPPWDAWITPDGATIGCQKLRSDWLDLSDEDLARFSRYAVQCRAQYGELLRVAMDICRAQGWPESGRSS